MKKAVWLVFRFIAAAIEFVAGAIRWVKNFFARTPEIPGNPYAYVMAPKKPRPPYRSAAAVAEIPEEEEEFRATYPPGQQENVFIGPRVH